MEILIACIILLICELPIELLRIYYRKKCNYNCDKCKCWDCPYLHCQYLKNKNKDNNIKE